MPSAITGTLIYGNREDTLYAPGKIDLPRASLYSVDFGGTPLACLQATDPAVLNNGERYAPSSCIILKSDCRFTLADNISLFYQWSYAEAKRKHDVNEGGYIICKSIELGAGSFGSVTLASRKQNDIDRQYAWKTTRVECACFKPRKCGCREGPLKSVMQEFDLLKKISHRNIMRVYDCFELSTTNPRVTEMAISLELCTGGTLYAHVQSAESFPVPDWKTILYQIGLGIRKLHELKLAHSDLKPENILLVRPGPKSRVVLGDFGLARPRCIGSTFGAGGTFDYLSPQARKITLSERFDPTLRQQRLPGDCWAYGVIMYCVLSSRHPFRGDSKIRDSRLPTQIDKESQAIDDAIALSEPDYRGIPDDAQDILRGLLMKQDRDRLTIHAAMGNAFFKNDTELVNDYRVICNKLDD